MPPSPATRGASARPIGSRALTRQPSPPGGAGLDLAAVDRDPLAQPEQPAAARRAVVGDLDREVGGLVAQDDRGAPGAGVARAAERLLHEPVGGQVDAGRQRARLALDAQLDRQPAGGEAAHERADVGEARLRGERDVLVLAAQHAEQAAQLRERLAPGLLDGGEGGLRRASGLRSASRRAAAACTVIALSAWATTSCSSPAIRVRSSSAALSAAPWRLSASCCAFSRSAALSRARLRMTWANSIGAATPSATELTNAVMSFVVGVGAGGERVERRADEGAEGQVAALGVGADRVGREQHPEERAGDVRVELRAADLQHADEADEDERERGDRHAPPHGQRRRP